MESVSITSILEKQEKVDYDIDKLFTIIYEIISIHKEFSELKKEINQYNLKKTQVRDILNILEGTSTYIIENEFLTSLRKYLDQLNFLTIDIDLDYTYNELDFRLRIKQPESIIYKLGHYHTGKQENGAISLNKCLNDLLGFRICLPYFNHECQTFMKICEYIGESYRIKYRNSSKGEYRATHIYFYGESNKYFPWELQIWLPEDFQSNYESHELHKQEYTNSAKIHKNAFNLEGVL